MRPWLRTRVKNLGATFLAVVAVGLGVCTLAGFFGELWWRFDILSHFRVQYALGLLACTTLYVATYHDIVAGLCAVGFVVNLVVIAPLHWGRDTVAADAPRFGVVVVNINDENTHYDAVINYLGSADADLLVILEVTDEWDRRLRAAFPDHHATGQWRTDSFGLLVLSRLPVQSSRLIHLANEEVAAAELTVQVGATSMAILAVHTLPPVRADWSRRRDAMIEAMATWANDRDEPTVILGDLNATPWAKPFRALLERTALKNSQRGFGVQPTWPRGMPWFGVAIDHCLVSQSVLVADRRRGPHLGSDHRVLHLQLALR